VQAQAKACGYLFLVPRLRLGTHLPAKLSLATIFVPKYNLGTRENPPLCKALALHRVKYKLSRSYGMLSKPELGHICVPKLELGNEMTVGRAHLTSTGWKPVLLYSKNPVNGEEAAAVSRSGPRPAR